ncbi:MAG: hypothetical protein EWV90_13685, partial [Microcystis aeruginosa Ma_QC_Ch_20071001_M135]
SKPLGGVFPPHPPPPAGGGPPPPPPPPSFCWGFVPPGGAPPPPSGGGGGGGGRPPPARGGGGGGDPPPQRLGLSDKIGSNTKSVEYGLHIKRGTHAKRRINNQFLITGFSITDHCLLITDH